MVGKTCEKVGFEPRVRACRPIPIASIDCHSKNLQKKKLKSLFMLAEVMCTSPTY